MNRRRSIVLRICSLLLCLVFLTGCQSQGTSDVPQITKEVADAMEEDEESTEDVEPLKEKNEIPKDGVITEAQMATIAGKQGIFYFNGKTEDGIQYQWAYEGKKVQNPQKQRLLVKISEEGTEQVKKAANNAPYALAITTQEMNIAAPARLTVTLNEQWDADKVLFCVYKDSALYKLDDALIETVKGKAGEVSSITFSVTQVGEGFYLVGGSTTGSSDDEKADDNSEKKKKETTQEGSQDNDTSSDEQTDSVGEDSSEDMDDTQSNALTCTISIDCQTILDNWDDLKSSKAEFVPSDGWILYESQVEFTQGETVFDVLKRVCNETGIQMESSWTPMYNSYYVEGINNLYEFDCGQNSGWMYNVNGWYPNYGCSSYTLEDGDVIQWRYTCTLGSDVGDQYYE